MSVLDIRQTRPTGKSAVPIVVHENALRGAVQIVVLTVADRPEERGKPSQAQEERGRNEDRQRRNHGSPALSLSALSVTRSEDDAMAIAAISGVTRPSAANGMAIAL